MNKIFVCLILMFLSTPAFGYTVDSIAESLKDEELEIPYANLDYDYESTLEIPISLKIDKPLTTKDKTLYEGKPVEFTAQNIVLYDRRILLRKGDKVKGKVKYIVSSGLNGIPYSITLGDFEFENISSNQIFKDYEKRGFSRTGFVLPLKLALTILPPTGSLTNFIKGGHAKITPKDNITIYFCPKWNEENL